eukprot:3940318-Rhodomonas_salina.3
MGSAEYSGGSGIGGTVCQDRFHFALRPCLRAKLLKNIPLLTVLYPGTRVPFSFRPHARYPGTRVPGYPGAACFDTSRHGTVEIPCAAGGPGQNFPTLQIKLYPGTRRRVPGTCVVLVLVPVLAVDSNGFSGIPRPGAHPNFYVSSKVVN